MDIDAAGRNAGPCASARAGVSVFLSFGQAGRRWADPARRAAWRQVEGERAARRKTVFRIQSGVASGEWLFYGGPALALPPPPGAAQPTRPRHPPGAGGPATPPVRRRLGRTGGGPSAGSVRCRRDKVAASPSRVVRGEAVRDGHAVATLSNESRAGPDGTKKGRRAPPARPAPSSVCSIRPAAVLLGRAVACLDGAPRRRPWCGRRSRRGHDRRRERARRRAGARARIDFMRRFADGDGGRGILSAGVAALVAPRPGRLAAPGEFLSAGLRQRQAHRLGAAFAAEVDRRDRSGGVDRVDDGHGVLFRRSEISGRGG